MLSPVVGWFIYGLFSKNHQKIKFSISSMSAATLLGPNLVLCIILPGMASWGFGYYGICFGSICSHNRRFAFITWCPFQFFGHWSRVPRPGQTKFASFIAIPLPVHHVKFWPDRTTGGRAIGHNVGRPTLKMAKIVLTTNWPKTYPIISNPPWTHTRLYYTSKKNNDIALSPRQSISRFVNLVKS